MVGSFRIALACRPAGESGCANNARVVVEKPFGRDFASAKELNRTLHQVFSEASIFRIDHFLGKEPVQNLLYVRFANRDLDPRSAAIREELEGPLR